MRFVPPVRRLVQGAFALFCLVVGYRFYHFFLWATGDGAFVSRPASVEAFLPVGALVSFKKLLLTGHYDRLHPAGLTIFMAALAIALLFRKGFCGWICPIGFLFDLQEAVVARFRRPLRLPGWLDYPLRSLKYLLLGAFLYLIGWQMDLQAIDGFMRSPYNVMVDARMLGFFLHPSAMAIGFFIFLFAAAMVLR
ncbi:MAG TPA: 4Fe-4S binding protein, partial [Desulfobacteraceae bacterium]|nr:4Fe-4S binding protein [Desulfobacteraceae bacterium]